ncbi:hypothetical protein [Lysinibacillus xylanilyticus]|uniref:hypothetical protein n=1 Tax=Lysinibacillus xylanilyticus TaxID=582475 RepID=UPI003D0206BD
MNELLKRINYGFDGLIRSLKVNNFNSAEIVISVQDTEINEWVNVKFIIEALEEFKILKNPRVSNVVLSSGIKIKEISGLYYIDFAPFSDEIDSVFDFRQSDIYFSGKLLRWYFEEYSEI